MKAWHGLLLIALAAFGVANSRADECVFVADRTDDSLRLVRGQSLEVLAEFPTEARGAYRDLVVGDRVYVSNAISNSVSVIHLPGGTVSLIDVGATPEEMAVTSDGKWLYVANVTGNSISLIDTSTDTVADTLPLIGSPTDLAITPGDLGMFALSVMTDATYNISIGPMPYGGVASFFGSPLALTYFQDADHFYRLIAIGGSVSGVSVANLSPARGAFGFPAPRVSDLVATDSGLAVAGTESTGEILLFDLIGQIAVGAIDLIPDTVPSKIQVALSRQQRFAYATMDGFYTVDLENLSSMREPGVDDGHYLAGLAVSDCPPGYPTPTATATTQATATASPTATPGDETPVPTATSALPPAAGGCTMGSSGDLPSLLWMLLPLLWLSRKALGRPSQHECLR